MTHIPASFEITNLSYTNLAFNPLNLVFKADVKLFPGGFTGNARITMTIKNSSTNQIITNQVLQTATPITGATDVKEFSFSKTFLASDIPANVTFEFSGCIVLSNGGCSGFITSTPLDVAFTGTDPDPEPEPKPDQVTTAFSNWTFQNNILNGKVFTNKTNLFPTQFDDRTLKQFIQVKNSSGQTIDLITTPFEFGLDTQVEFNYNNTNVALREVNVSLFVWTLDNFPVSLSQNQTFIQSAPDPIPDPDPDPIPDPTELPSTNFIVSFSNNEPDKFYTLSDPEFALLKLDIAPCASITQEADSNNVSMGLVFVQNDIIKICQGTKPQLPSNV